MSPDQRSWRAAWPGFCATLTAVGIGRFSYTPLIPFLIAEGILSETAAAYLAAAIAAATSWRGWQEGSPVRPRRAAAPSPGRRRFDVPVVFLIFAFAADGGGFVPHTIFWVDFIARELGFGATAGAFNWLLFGL